jgi:hypothetical protein
MRPLVGVATPLSLVRFDDVRAIPVSWIEQVTTATLGPQAKENLGTLPDAHPLMQRANDGSVLWWATDAPAPPATILSGTPVPVRIAVSPVRPGHSVAVDYRVNNGPIRQAVAVPDPRSDAANTRMFRAVLPGQSDGTVELVPVLRFAGQPVSPGLGDSPDRSSFQVVRRDGAPVAAARTLEPRVEPTSRPLWDWGSKWLGTCTIMLRKEVVGIVPDGLRVDWHFIEGRFVGPDLEGTFLPGGADWMRIRVDGVALVDVKGCLQTKTGGRIYCTYQGAVDLGPDGYARALRGEFDPLPPFVGNPTYATAEKSLQWLNRAQCIAVGCVDMKALRVEYDAYVIQVGGRARAP